MSDHIPAKSRLITTHLYFESLETNTDEILLRWENGGEKQAPGPRGGWSQKNNSGGNQ